ncbi:MAG: ferritin-like domain-containing protein [Planctomycetaceae bacterium]|jgi:bacterioferritin|nr:ferritin-like domain-containing protein [Planctomycetaceae bacterium]
MSQQQQLTAKLNEQLNREVTTFPRYMVQGASIQGAEWESVRAMYLAEVTDEVGHAQYLANQIVALGSTPDIQPELAAPLATPQDMLERDIVEEQTDVANYVALAELAGKQGLYALKMAMEQQAADEDEHRQTMQRLLGKLLAWGCP